MEKQKHDKITERLPEYNRKTTGCRANKDKSNRDMTRDSTDPEKATKIAYVDPKKRSVEEDYKYDKNRIKFVDWKTGNVIPFGKRKHFARDVLSGLHEYYLENKPDDRATFDEMTDDILAQVALESKKPPKDFTVRVLFKPEDTDSFIKPMKDLKDFIPEARQSFLDDALEHLDEMDETRSTERKNLLKALEKAGKFLDEQQKERLKALRERPALERETHAPKKTQERESRKLQKEPVMSGARADMVRGRERNREREAAVLGR